MSIDEHMRRWAREQRAEHRLIRWKGAILKRDGFVVCRVKNRPEQSHLGPGARRGVPNSSSLKHLYGFKSVRTHEFEWWGDVPRFVRQALKERGFEEPGRSRRFTYWAAWDNTLVETDRIDRLAAQLAKAKADKRKADRKREVRP